MSGAVQCFSAVGRPGRLLVARLLPDQDVVEGIVELARSHGLRSGSVLAIGSLKGATVVYPNTMEFGDNPMDAAVFHRMEGPVELGSGQGFFGTDEAGQVVAHIHGVIMDKDGNMRCGNLQPGSAPVLATVELSIQEFEGIDLRPTLDPVFKAKLLRPTTGGTQR